MAEIKLTAQRRRDGFQLLFNLSDFYRDPATGIPQIATEMGMIDIDGKTIQLQREAYPLQTLEGCLNNIFVVLEKMERKLGV